MKILFISDFFPDPNIPGGASTRVYYIMRELVRNHSVDLLSTRWPGIQIDLEKIKDICNNAYFYEFSNKQPAKKLNGKFIERFRELGHILFESTYMVQSTLRHWNSFQSKLNEIDLSKYDLIQIEDSYIAYRLFKTKKKFKNMPVVIDLHNVNSLIEKRNFQHTKGWRWRFYVWTEWKKMLNYESRIFNTFDLNLTCSDEDRRIAKSMVSKARFEVIPNGVDVEYFKPNGKFETNALVFLGSDWTPNVDGLLYFYKEIWPEIKKSVPDVKLYIVGNFSKNESIKALAGNDIILTGYVKDVREWVNKGAVSIVPLRLGGGTRLKVVEAMALGKAIVSTSIGIEGIDVLNGKDVILADEPHSFAESVIKLLNNEKECIRLGNNARRLAEEKYDWKIIVDKLSNVYEELLNGKKK